jgi:hypothetical protein
VTDVTTCQYPIPRSDFNVGLFRTAAFGFKPTTTDQQTLVYRASSHGIGVDRQLGLVPFQQEAAVELHLHRGSPRRYTQHYPPAPAPPSFFLHVPSCPSPPSHKNTCSQVVNTATDNMEVSFVIHQECQQVWNSSGTSPQNSAPTKASTNLRIRPAMNGFVPCVRSFIPIVATAQHCNELRPQDFGLVGGQGEVAQT